MSARLLKSLRLFLRAIGGPWPFRPWWVFALLGSFQVFGFGEQALEEPGSVFMGRPVLDVVLQVLLLRVFPGLLLAACVVLVAVAVHRTAKGADWPKWLGYWMATIAGALTGTGLRLGVEYVRQSTLDDTQPIMVLNRYFMFLVGIQTAIGVVQQRLLAHQQALQLALARSQEQALLLLGSEERARRAAAEYLHDRVQADLLVVGMQLRQIGEDASSDVSSRLASVTEVLESIRFDDVRAASRLLSPLAQVEHVGPALTELGKSWSKAMHVSVDIDPDAEAALASFPDADARLGVYRIVEQSLLNAAAHGRATEVQVQLQLHAERDHVRAQAPGAASSDGVVELRVIDNGVGLRGKTPSQGEGMAIMDAWARTLGGTVRLSDGSSDADPAGTTSSGCILTATLPRQPLPR